MKEGRYDKEILETLKSIDAKLAVLLENKLSLDSIVLRLEKQSPKQENITE